MDLPELCSSIDAETAGRDGAPATHPEFDRLVRTMWRLRQPDGPSEARAARFSMP